MSLFTPLSRSLYKKHSTDPCGTLLVTFLHCEKWLCIYIFISYLLISYEKSCRTFLLNPCHLNSCQSFDRGVSQRLFGNPDSLQAKSLFPVCFLTLPVTSTRFGRQDFPQQKTSWFLMGVSHICIGYVLINIYSFSEFASCSSRVVQFPKPLHWGSFHTVLFPACLRGSKRGHGEWQAAGSQPSLQPLQLWAANPDPGKAPSPQLFNLCEAHRFHCWVFHPPLLILKTKRRGDWRSISAPDTRSHFPRFPLMQVWGLFWDDAQRRVNCILILVWKNKHSCFKNRKLNLFLGTMCVLFPSSPFPPAFHWLNIMVCFQTAVP